MFFGGLKSKGKLGQEIQFLDKCIVCGSCNKLISVGIFDDLATGNNLIFVIMRVETLA